MKKKKKKKREENGRGSVVGKRQKDISLFLLFLSLSQAISFYVRWERKRN